MTGYHYHNRDTAGPNQGAEFLRNTLVDRLQNGSVWLPLEERDDLVEPVSMKELGIGYPVVIDPGRVEDVEVPDPDFRPDQYEKAAAPKAGRRTSRRARGPAIGGGLGGGMMGAALAVRWVQEGNRGRSSPRKSDYDDSPSWFSSCGSPYRQVIAMN